jgi:antitoxin component of MazEF toxin-antitoxin module
MSAKPVGIAKVFKIGTPGSMALIIPKDLWKSLAVAKGRKYFVSGDEKGRIVYEPIQHTAANLDKNCSSRN